MATTTVSTNLSPFITFVEQASTPSTPAAGNGLLYRKTDNLWYVLDDAGTETQISTGAAASYILQSLADAKGDLIIASADNTFAKHTAPADGSVLLSDSSQSDGWSSLLHKFDGTTAPTANEDTGDGYAVGSLWMDTTNDKAYVCLDATSTAAVWTEITGSPGGGGDITTDAAWAAKGDLIVGTGDDTASILTVGTDNYVLTAASAQATGLKWAAVASSGLTTGTSFPGSPSAGDRYRRSDLDYLVFLYDGTRWVSEQMLTASDAKSVTATATSRIALPVDYDVYLVSWSYQMRLSTSGASWTLQVDTTDFENDSATLDSYTLSAYTATNIYADTRALGDALTTSGGNAENVVRGLMMRYIEDSGSASLDAATMFLYRLIAT